MVRATTAAALMLIFLILMDYSAMTMALRISSSNADVNSIADVNIYSQVGGTLRLHCKSKDDDLGEHTLLDGQHFGWGFTPNFWGTTLYYCNFVWGAKSREGVVVFDSNSSKVGCFSHCVWQVRNDGFWVTEAGVVPFKFVAPWK